MADWLTNYCLLGWLSRNFMLFNLPEGQNVNVVESVALINDNPLVQRQGGGIWRHRWLVGQIRDGSLPGYKHSASAINGPTLNQLCRQKPVFIFINTGSSFVWVD